MRHIFLFCLLSFALCLICHAETTPRVSVDEFITVLQQDRISIAGVTVVETELRDRQRLVDALCAYIDKYASEDVKTLSFNRSAAVSRAMQMLGELRAAEAAKVLVHHLTYMSPLDAISSGVCSHLGESPRDNFPALQSLIQIGLPAFPPLLTAVEQGVDETTLKIIATIFVSTLGRDEALAYLDVKGKQEHDKTFRTRLVSLQRIIQRDFPVKPNRQDSVELKRQRQGNKVRR